MRKVRIRNEYTKGSQLVAPVGEKPIKERRLKCFWHLFNRSEISPDLHIERLHVKGRGGGVWGERTTC